MNFWVLLFIGGPIIVAIDRIRERVTEARAVLDSLGLCRQV